MCARVCPIDVTWQNSARLASSCSCCKMAPGRAQKHHRLCHRWPVSGCDKQPGSACDKGLGMLPPLCSGDVLFSFPWLTPIHLPGMQGQPEMLLDTLQLPG